MIREGEGTPQVEHTDNFMKIYNISVMEPERCKVNTYTLSVYHEHSEQTVL